MLDLSELAADSRLLIEADLRPVQGHRFQPTGFPDLGAATYQNPDGVDMLLVESAQSMANHLEGVCWDAAEDDLVQVLAGLPYVRVHVPATRGKDYTTSILEFHRLNSPYIMGSEGGFRETLSIEAGISRRGASTTSKDSSDKDKTGNIDIGEVARACFKYDPGSVLHGVFLEKIDGRARLTRLLSAFIEATDVKQVESGGVKFDRINPSGNTGEGFGHVPFHRTEYVAKTITAYFSFDLAALRGYGLGSEAERLLITLALWKIAAFLDGDLRLRTACDLEVVETRVTRPSKFMMPTMDALDESIREAIAACTACGMFAQPAVTALNWSPKKAAKPKKESASDDSDDQ